MEKLSGLSPKKLQHNNISHPFITLVDQILAAKKQQPPSSPFVKGEFTNADTSALERQIDEMVYKLYGLTEEEMKPVFINVGAGLVPALI
jgi:hypothetical protein